jgi:hypothetical protein
VVVSTFEETARSVDMNTLITKDCNRPTQEAVLALFRSDRPRDALLYKKLGRNPATGSAKFPLHRSFSDAVVPILGAFSV